MGEPLGPGAAVVATMADPSEALACHEKVHAAVLAWAAERDPIPWNVWQQEARRIAEAEVPGFTTMFQAPGPNWTQYNVKLWEEVMSPLHGPDWRKLCRAQQGAPLRPAALAASAGGDGPVTGARAEVPAAVAGEVAADAADAPAASSGGAGLAPSPDAVGSPDVGEPEQFVIATAPPSGPPSAAGGARVGWEPGLSQEAVDVMSEMAPGGSETYSDLEGRILLISQTLTDNGLSNG